MSATCIFPTAAAVSAPAGALPVFPHCRSSARSRRSLPSTSPLPQQCLLPQERKYISPLPQQCLLPQEHNIYSPTAAAVPAPAGAFPVFSSLPQQCPLPQEPSQYFPHCHSSVRSRRSSIDISPLPHQLLPSPPPSSPHAATAAHFSRSRFFL